MMENGFDAKNRDLLIRLEQQLKDANENHAQMLGDLKEIFHRLERESKSITSLEGELKTVTDTTKIRWDELEKKLLNILNRLDETEEETKEDSKALADEKRERETFQQEIKSSIRTVGWLLGAIVTLGSIISGFLLIVQIAAKLKVGGP